MDRITLEYLPGRTAEVDESNPVFRFPANPILTPRIVNSRWSDPAAQVITVHNAGIVQHGATTYMLFRSHLRCGKSLLGLARSATGLNDWHVDPAPVFKPASPRDLFAQGIDNVSALVENEAGGVEDPRITRLDEEYAITYSAYHQTMKNRVRVSLATTRDFSRFLRHGPVLEHDMRNVALFPEKIGGRYAGLFRPNDITAGDTGGIYTQIRLGYTDNWRSGRWDILDEPIMRTGGGPSAFSDKIGPGAPPLKTRKGWLSIFHGVRTTMDGNPYVLGVMLHDLNDPSKVQVSSIPILFPTRADCRVPEDAYVHVPNVVFTCGAVHRPDGSIFLYYGGNDTVMNLGITHEDVLIALCEKYPQDGVDGSLQYAV
jgi:predicted GH43/DUF377 family glycosyl hydrolase